MNAETLSDLLADLPDLSRDIAKASDAVSTAESVESVTDLLANLDDAEDALRDAIKAIKTLRKQAMEQKEAA
jgi:ABC-type transporter Mla subunit MlaD